MTGKVDVVLSKLKNRKKVHDGWVASCPAHKDNDPSLHITVTDTKILLQCFAGCNYKDIIEAVGLTEQDLFLDDGNVRKFPGRGERTVVTLHSLSKYTGLQPEFLSGEKIALKDGTGCVLVPYFNESGEFLYNKKRVNLSEKPKYVYEKTGIKTLPYGLWRIGESAHFGNSMVIVEGESDCWTLWRHGIPALGIPGANNLSCLTAEMLIGINQLFLVRENDDAGTKFSYELPNHLIESGYRGKIKIMRLGPYKDANELHQSTENHDQFLEEFRKYSKQAEESGHLRSEDLLETYREVVHIEHDFLWHPYIPIGSLTILAGKPGQGKSFAAIDIAARVSNGSVFPDQKEVGPAGKVVIFAAEDDAPTIKRRLVNCNANLANTVGFNLEKFPFRLNDPKSIAHLERICEMLKPRLVIIDPLVAFIDTGTDINRANHVREVMRPLADIAKRHATSILVIAHQKKGQIADSLDAITGSVDFIAAVRSGLLVCQDPSDDSCRVLAHIKHNLTEEGQALRFSISGGMSGARFEWFGASEMTGDEIISSGGNHEDRIETKDAKSFIASFLRAGPKAIKEVIKEGENNGFNKNTIKTAARRMGIISDGGDEGKVRTWQLPEGFKLNKSSASLVDEKGELPW